jgi:hypothetical protein
MTTRYPRMLTPAELREGSRRAREVALTETTPHLRQALAAHALALAALAERLEREFCEAADATPDIKAAHGHPIGEG